MKFRRYIKTKHLKNIFAEDELAKDSICVKIAHTASDGKKYNSKVSALLAKEFAEGEYEKFIVKQDRIYQSDFDRLVLEKEKDK